jgi:hypothetical protein
MTIGKASILAAGFVGAFALGVVVGPSMTDRVRDRRTAISERAVETSPPSAATTKAPAAASQRTRTARSTPRAAARATAESVGPVAAIPATQPDVQQRLKKVLNRGANMTIAAEGFQNAEQFATVAHAARNTEVPFMLLKHRVLNEGRTLEQAILASKPAADAEAEVRQARAAAKSDLAAISG